LPNGLIFDTSTGTVSGTPVAILASTTFTVTVTDALSQTSSKTFALSVIAQPLIATIVTPTLVFAVYTQITPSRPVTAVGGTGLLTFDISPALPAGLSFNTLTGQITGTPTDDVPAANFVITVTDTVSVTTSKIISIAVNDVSPPALIASAQNNSQILEINSDSNVQPVIASGGFGTLAYAISPVLPAGLSFDTTSGFISGQPTVLSTSTVYTVSVTDEDLAEVRERLGIQDH